MQDLRQPESVCDGLDNVVMDPSMSMTAYGTDVGSCRLGMEPVQMVNGAPVGWWSRQCGRTVRGSTTIVTVERTKFSRACDERLEMRSGFSTMC